MGKSLSKSSKNKSEGLTSSSLAKVKKSGDKLEKKEKVKPPKFPINKPKNDKFDRDLKRSSNKRKRSTKARLDNMKPLPPPAVPQKFDSSKVLSEQNYDELAIRKMKNLLARDSESFLLNQLLLSVQFYTNFER